MPVSNAEVSVDEEEDNEQSERDNDNNNNSNKSKKKKKEAKGNRFLIPFVFVSKAKKRIVSKIRRKPLSPSPPSASSGFWKKVCFCGIQSFNTLEWSSSSNPDPEDDNFTLRVLLQTNDFFSDKSNPHL